MTRLDEGRSESFWQVKRAFAQAVGEQRAGELFHRPSKHLADLSPEEVAQTPAGARIVLAELPKIAKLVR